MTESRTERLTERRLGRGAAAVLLAWWVSTAPAAGQGVAPDDDYTTAFGGPHYTGNLTPLPDDSLPLGPRIRAGDPWLEVTRPARGHGEVADIGAGFWEWRADRLRQMREDADRLDAERRAADARWRAGLEPPWKPRWSTGPGNNTPVGREW